MRTQRKPRSAHPTRNQKFSPANPAPTVPVTCYAQISHSYYYLQIRLCPLSISLSASQEMGWQPHWRLAVQRPSPHESESSFWHLPFLSL